MFNRKNLVTRLVLVGSLLAAGGVSAQASHAAGAPGVELNSESKIWLNGDSTLHPFSATSRKVELSATLTPGASVQGMRLANLEVTVPVRSLKSGDGALDNNMYKAMNADRYPTIKFNLEQAHMHVSPGGEVEVKADGHLTIAGTEKTEAIHAEGKLNGNNFHLTGSKELTISEFGVKPPVIMFGAVRVKDRVVIHYDLVGELTNAQ